MIVIVYPLCSGVGGIARYVRSYVENYPADAPRLLVLTGETGAPDRLPDNVVYEHIPVTQDRLALAKWGLKVRRRLKDIARKTAIEAVNLHIPPMIPGLFLPDVAPIVVTAHTTYVGMAGQFHAPPHFQSQWSASAVKIKQLMERAIFRRASAIITLTEQGRQELACYGYGGPVAIIPNGVDVDQFTPVADAPRKFDVIFTGRIEGRKGSRPMVDVVKALVARDPSISICIVGYGEDLPYVEANLAPLGANVTLTGKIPFEQIAQLLNRSRIYASTSYYEGLPGTCLEAMAMGLPAVVWDYLFYDNLVIDGVTGLRAVPNDIGGFVDKVMCLRDDESANIMGSRAREVVREHYDWRRLSGTVTQFLRSRQCERG